MRVYTGFVATAFVLGLAIPTEASLIGDLVSVATADNIGGVIKRQPGDRH